MLATKCSLFIPQQGSTDTSRTGTASEPAEITINSRRHVLAWTSQYLCLLRLILSWQSIPFNESVDLPHPNCHNHTLCTTVGISSIAPHILLQMFIYDQDIHFKHVLSPRKSWLQVVLGSTTMKDPEKETRPNRFLKTMYSIKREGLTATE